MIPRCRRLARRARLLLILAANLLATGCAQVVPPGHDVRIVYPLDGLLVPPSFTLLVSSLRWDRGVILYNGPLDTQPEKRVTLHPVPAWLEVDGHKLRDLPNHMLHRIPIGPLAAGPHRIVLHGKGTVHGIRVQVVDPFPLHFEAVRHEASAALAAKLDNRMAQKLNANPETLKALCPGGYCPVKTLVSGHRALFYLERADGSAIGWIGQATDSGVEAVLTRMRRQPDKADVTMRVANGTFPHACGDGGFLWLEWQDKTYRLVRWINGKERVWRWRERDERQWARALGAADYQPGMAYGQAYCQKSHALVHRGKLLLLFDPSTARPKVVVSTTPDSPDRSGDLAARWLDPQEKIHELGPGRVVSALHLGQTWWLLRGTQGRLPWLSPLTNPEQRLAVPVVGKASSWDLDEFFFDFDRKAVLPIVGSVASSPREDAPVGLAAQPGGPGDTMLFVLSGTSGR